VSSRRRREVLGRWAAHASSLGIAEYDLRRLLAMSPDELKARRAALQALEDARAEARTRLTERQRALALEESKRDRYREHHPELAALAPPELDSRLTALEALPRPRRAAVPVQEHAGPGGGGLKAGTLQEELAAQQAVADHWQRLSTISSASGAKLRTFAQSLTLERLLLKANAQLAELSPAIGWSGARHRSGAAVVDLDMGDEVRSVDSLSGGELPGVAGAGAGPLQPVVAPDPGRIAVHRRGLRHPRSRQPGSGALKLDSLQAAGRQIGVISHVQTLVERIGVQVRVEALGGGESRVVLP
jgi:exonuclease SbcC